MPVDYKSMYYLLLGKTLTTIKVLDTTTKMLKVLEELKEELEKAVGDVDEIYIQTDDDKHEE